MRQISDMFRGIQQGSRRKRVTIFVLALILVIAITVSLHYVYGRHPERLAELKDYAYIGAFLISLIGNATIIFPGAVLVILVNMSIVLYPSAGLPGPVFVALAGAAGAAIGEMTGYVLGYGGSAVVQNSRLYLRLVKWVRRWGVPTIFVLSIIPFFFDLVGIAAGASRFPLWKFVVLCWSGRTILYVALCLAGAFGYQSILPFFS